MPLEWDPAKDAQNVARRGISFAIVERLEWETSVTIEDTRDYGERRFITVGVIDAQLYVVVWTPRGEHMRIISVRKADARDRRIYEQETEPLPD